MARPREFDPEIALAGAMETFWQYGYEASSLPRILSGMGLTKGSFYKAFVDKKSLFIQILDRYKAEAVNPAIALLEDETKGDGITRIELLFNTIVSAVENGDRRGCLLCSTVATPAYLETEITDRADVLVKEMHSGFVSALKSSSIAPDQIENLAHMLISQYVGMQVLSRSDTRAENLGKSSNALIKMLRTFEAQ